jgi:hypothetical protein
MLAAVYSNGAPISGITLTSDPSATWLTASLLSTTPAAVLLTVDPTMAPSGYTTTLTISAPNQ